jgi:hypothetical protein
MRQLIDHDWPGNVRELENCVERAIVLSEGTQIESDALPERLRHTSSPAATAPSIGPDDDDLSIKRAARRSEELLIRRALQKTRGNRTRAAELLEISHRALLYKIKEYGIAVGRDTRELAAMAEARNEGSLATPTPLTPSPMTPSPLTPSPLTPPPMPPTPGPHSIIDSTWKAK